MLLPRYRPDQPQPLQPRRHLNDKLKQITNRDTTQATIQAGPQTDDPTHKRLRGIPCIAQAVTGTQPGTDPLLELLRNDNRRRYGNAA